MENKLFILFTLVVAIILLGMKIQPQSSNLLLSEEAWVHRTFVQWMEANGKHYRQKQETAYRFKKFYENYQFVKMHNHKYEKGEESFEVELNQFADLDNIEFMSIYTGYKKSKITHQCFGKVNILDNPPASVTWENRAVSSVKTQGSCGSCYAFSASGAIQGLYAVKHYKIISFSTQQLVDCSYTHGNDGCNGGDTDATMQYVIDNGITTDKRYPYKQIMNNCAYNSTMKEYSISDCVQVPPNNTIALKSAVVQQPVSVSVQGNGLAFQMYKQGVFTGKCGTDLNHAILLVGYGTLTGKSPKDYWRCKNSWGKQWGDNGFINLERTNDNGPGKCGVLMEPNFPLE